MAWLSSNKQQMSLCMSSVWETLSSKLQCYRVWLHEIRDWIWRLETTHATQLAIHWLPDKLWGHFSRLWVLS